MSNRDTRFSKSQEYREISDRDLFYDLDYVLLENGNVKFNNNSILIYLFFITAILNFYFGINQSFTLIFCIGYLILHQFAKAFFGLRKRIFVLGLILIATIIDHTQASLLILPGSITNENFSIFTWVFEILWVLVYGVEFLTIFAPIQQSATPGRTILPATENSEKSYKGLERRVAGSNYSITDFDEEVDTSLLQESFRNLTQYIIIAFIVIVLLDLFIWELISIFAGGNNTDEEYFVSGMSFIVYTLLLVYAGLLFKNGNSEEKNR